MQRWQRKPAPVRHGHRAIPNADAGWCDTHAHADTHTRRRNADAYSGRCDAHADAYTRRRNADSDRDAGRLDTNSDADTHARRRDADTHTYAHTNPDGNADTVTDAGPDRR